MKSRADIVDEIGSFLCKKSEAVNKAIDVLNDIEIINNNFIAFYNDNKDYFDHNRHLVFSIEGDLMRSVERYLKDQCSLDKRSLGKALGWVGEVDFKLKRIDDDFWEVFEEEYSIPW